MLFTLLAIYELLNHPRRVLTAYFFFKSKKQKSRKSLLGDEERINTR